MSIIERALAANQISGFINQISLKSNWVNRRDFLHAVIGRLNKNERRFENHLIEWGQKCSWQDCRILKSNVSQVRINKFWHADPAGNYMFKVNNRNTRTSCEICSKLTINIEWGKVKGVLKSLSMEKVFLKGVLKNFSKFTVKHLCQSLFFCKVAGQACNFIKKETLVQLFSCKFCEIFKNTFFTEHLRTTTSGSG